MSAASARSSARPVELAAVAAGGVLGAEARLGVCGLMPTSSPGVPWSTLVINTSGCLLVGVVVAVLVSRAANPLARLFLAVGVLGGYTTFSGYTVDAVRLLDAGRPLVAGAYVAATLVLAVAAVAVGGAAVRVVLGGRGAVPPAQDPGRQARRRRPGGPPAAPDGRGRSDAAAPSDPCGPT